MGKTDDDCGPAMVTVLNPVMLSFMPYTTLDLSQFPAGLTQFMAQLLASRVLPVSGALLVNDNCLTRTALNPTLAMPLARIMTVVIRRCQQRKPQQHNPHKQT